MEDLLIKVGDRVKDQEGLIGIISEIQDNHNIWVNFETEEGSSVYCMVPECELYCPLEKVE